MQLLPATAEQVALRSGLSFSPESLIDPRVNIDLGLRYMRQLREQFNHNEEHALAAYNLGPHAVRTRLRNGDDMEVPYVTRVMALLRKTSKHPGIPLASRRRWNKAWL
jgi:soluble lytic murein transglycosylase-like protein